MITSDLRHNTNKMERLPPVFIKRLIKKHA